MTKTKTTDTLIAQLDQLALDAPSWPAAFAAAKSSRDADHAAAEERLFPFEVAPVPGDAIAAYSHYIGRFAVSSYAAELAQLHGRSLRTHPALATLCRSAEAQADVVSAVAATSPPPAPGETFARAAARVGEIARRRYQLTIAQQIAAVDDHEFVGAARGYVAAIANGDRLDALKARRDEHVRVAEAEAEAERLEAEQAAERERQAAECERELAAELANRSRDGVTAAERRRLAEAVQLRVRLRASGLTSLRVGGALYGARELALRVTDFPLEKIWHYAKALDVQERKANGASEEHAS